MIEYNQTDCRNFIYEVFTSPRARPNLSAIMEIKKDENYPFM